MAGPKLVLVNWETKHRSDGIIMVLLSGVLLELFLDCRKEALIGIEIRLVNEALTWQSESLAPTPPLLTSSNWLRCVVITEYSVT